MGLLIVGFGFKIASVPFTCGPRCVRGPHGSHRLQQPAKAARFAAPCRCSCTLSCNGLGLFCGSSRSDRADLGNIVAIAQKEHQAHAGLFQHRPPDILVAMVAASEPTRPASSISGCFRICFCLCGGDLYVEGRNILVTDFAGWPAHPSWRPPWRYSCSPAASSSPPASV
jgi:hypothetical protein